MVSNQQSSAMNKIEKQTAFSLSAVFAIRMLGLFMVLPVFSLLGNDLAGSTPTLIGLAIGAYGLTQAIFQIPFGRLSDRFGRKVIVLIGLGLFALGSLVAGFSDSIYGVIVGRLLQGSGAIAGAVMALAADLSRDEQRSKVMASIGMSIGVAFTLSMFAGPMIASFIGLSGLFFTSAGLAVFAALIIVFWTPSPITRFTQRDAVAAKGQIKSIALNPDLWPLNFGIMALHCLLTSFFVAFPIKLQQWGLNLESIGGLYLMVMIIAGVLMIPGIIAAEKYQKHRNVMVSSMLVLAILQMVIGFYEGGLWGLVILLGLFFAAFNIMEGLFPSLISRIAPVSCKGTALGVYSTSQFLGAAIGGPLAGLLLENTDISMTYVFGAALALVWAIIGLRLKSPPRLTSYTLSLHHIEHEDGFTALMNDILSIRGVAEAVALPEAGAVYLKVDKQNFDEAALHQLKTRSE